MGLMPFDVDEWMRKGLESDLPLPKLPNDHREGEEREYHFNVMGVGGAGTWFQLRYSPQRGPYLMVSGYIYPADLDGLRSVFDYLNRTATGSVLDRRYIWLFGNDHLAVEASREHSAVLEAIMERERRNPGGRQRPVWRRRRRWWPWSRG
jgi:hypothetical protein